MRQLTPQEEAAIEALHLDGPARKAARMLKALHPNIVFTSGRRTAAAQAHAMAVNIIKSRKRNWIALTYLSGAKLQQWVDAHPEADTVDELAAGLALIFAGMSDAERSKISKHLNGRAFDVQPVLDNGAAIVRDIRKLPGVTKFLTKEGGLIRWHVQF